MDELRSPAYWVGHFFTIAATIIGVYYAAVVGFDAALKLDLVKADRSTYFVAESMYKELDFNVHNMDKYIDRVKNERYVYNEHLAGIKLNDYVFQASKNSESMFEIEPKLLTEVSIYYFTVGNAIEHYYESGKQSPSSLIKVVQRETQKLKEQKTLERLAAYNKGLADSVEARGISLEQPGIAI